MATTAHVAQHRSRFFGVLRFAKDHRIETHKRVGSDDQRFRVSRCHSQRFAGRQGRDHLGDAQARPDLLRRRTGVGLKHEPQASEQVLTLRRARSKDKLATIRQAVTSIGGSA